MGRLRIFLADLIHNRHIYHYAVPLNIAYIAARLKQQVGDEVDISIFKFPDDLISALSNPPDIIALSNYDWNVNLNRTIISLIKNISPNTLIIMGGPNIRKSEEGIRQFILTNHTDLYVVNEGEESFCGIIEYILSKWPCNIKKCIFHDGIRLPGTAFVEEETKKLFLGDICKTSTEDPIPFPSAWLGGFLDSYLNSTSFPLAPLIETNRGCPYQCFYCTWGNFKNKKVRKFEMETVVEELRYIFRKAKNKFHLTIADANFGIFDRDIDIAIEIRRLSDKYKKLDGVDIFQAKNNIQRNLEIIKILGKLSLPDFAVQTFNTSVLRNIGRKNIKLDSIKDYVNEVNDYGLQVYTDILLGLPGETKESHIGSMKKALDIGFCDAPVGDIRLLSGSRMEEDDYRKKYDIESRFRVIPSAYGEYAGSKVIEYEECIRKTNTMKEKDFLELRLFHANFFLLYSIELARPLADYSKKHGLHPIDLVSKITEKPSRKKYPFLSKQIDKYLKQAEEEWFESEDKANEYYLNNGIFQKIMKNGFPKLNYEYAVQLVLNMALRREFIGWMADNIKETLDVNAKPIVDDIAEFCIKRYYCHPFDNTQHMMEISYNSLKELETVLNNSIVNKLKNKPAIRLKFDIDANKVNDLNKEIKRYGGTNNLSLAIQTILQINLKTFIMKASIY